MKELTDESINKKEKDSDGSSETKGEPENLSGPTADKFYSEDRQVLRKWFEENHSTSTGAWMTYDKKVSGKRTLTYDDIVVSFRILNCSLRTF